VTAACALVVTSTAQLLPRGCQRAPSARPPGPDRTAGFSFWQNPLLLDPDYHRPILQKLCKLVNLLEPPSKEVVPPHSPRTAQGRTPSTSCTSGRSSLCLRHR
jgi:hypothetical protein